MPKLNKADAAVAAVATPVVAAKAKKVPAGGSGKTVKAPAKAVKVTPVKVTKATEVKAKAAKKSAPAKAAKAKGESVRVRSLKALAAKGDMSAPEIQKAIGLNRTLKEAMDQEVLRGHLSYAPSKGDSPAVVFHITAKGKKALADGTVDTFKKADVGL